MYFSIMLKDTNRGRRLELHLSALDKGEVQRGESMSRAIKSDAPGVGLVVAEWIEEMKLHKAEWVYPETVIPREVV